MVAKGPKRVGAEPVTDDDLVMDRLNIGEDGTLYAEMLTDLAKKVEKEELLLPVPNRPDFQIKFVADVSYDEYNMWQRRATDKKKKELDPLKMSFTVLSHCSRGLVYKGREMNDSSGEPLVFANNELHKMMGVPIGGTAMCIRKMYGADGHLVIVMNRILVAAGFDPEADIDDESGDDPLMDSGND